MMTTCWIGDVAAGIASEIDGRSAVELEGGSVRVGLHAARQATSSKEARREARLVIKARCIYPGAARASYSSGGLPDGFMCKNAYGNTGAGMAWNGSGFCVR